MSYLAAASAAVVSSKVQGAGGATGAAADVGVTTLVEKKAPTLRGVYCYYCDEAVVKEKGSFTGIFVDENGVDTQLTFCQRHSRKFLKRENEPMDLTEVICQIQGGGVLC